MDDFYLFRAFPEIQTKGKGQTQPSIGSLMAAFHLDDCRDITRTFQDNGIDMRDKWRFFFNKWRFSVDKWRFRLEGSH